GLARSLRHALAEGEPALRIRTFDPRPRRQDLVRKQLGDVGARCRRGGDPLRAPELPAPRARTLPRMARGEPRPALRLDPALVVDTAPRILPVSVALPTARSRPRRGPRRRGPRRDRAPRRAPLGAPRG